MRCSSSAIGCSNSRKVVFTGRRFYPFARKGDFPLCSNDLIPTSGFPLVQTGVGAREQCAAFLATHMGSHAYRYGDLATRRHARKARRRGLGAHALGTGECALAPGVGQDDEEFFSAEAAVN